MDEGSRLDYFVFAFMYVQLSVEIYSISNLGFDLNFFRFF